MPSPLTRTEIEIESFRRHGLSEVSIVDFIDHEDRRPVRRWRAWFTAVHAAQEEAHAFDLNLPYSRAVEMCMRSSMPTLDFGFTAEAARRITKLGQARRLTGGYPESKRAGLPIVAGEGGGSWHRICR
jgi:hypothetical protein